MCHDISLNKTIKTLSSCALSGGLCVYSSEMSKLHGQEAAFRVALRAKAKTRSVAAQPCRMRSILGLRQSEHVHLD